MNPQLTILSMDELSLYFQATLTRVYAPRGQTPIVPVSPNREHIHFYGALDVRTGREVAVPALEQNAEVTADFIRLLLVLFPTQPIFLLLDRASWHHGEAIDDVLAENPRLELMFYPPACPELNPQEHVWEQTRDAISHNHHYTNFEPLITDFETYLVETPFQTDFLARYGPPIDSAVFE